MLKGKLIHPEIMQYLSLCGHGSKVLIADGNYPLKAKAPNAHRIYLGLTPGKPTVPEVLEALLSVEKFESMELMLPESGEEPPIFGEFRKLLPDVPVKMLGRYGFYDACCDPIVELAISTGEERPFANILLTVGCV